MQADQATRLLVTVEEAARALGLGRSLVYELVLRNEIPSIKVGRARRIPIKALEDFVASQITRR